MVMYESTVADLWCFQAKLKGSRRDELHDLISRVDARIKALRRELERRKKRP